MTVALREVGVRPTAVVPARTTWAEFPVLWPALLDEVWTCLRAAGVSRGCRNVMLYRTDTPEVEVGVLLAAPVPLSGRVVASALPAGRVAWTTHRGPYARLAASHEAVIRWCAAKGLRRAGPRWEVYGPHREDPADLETEIFHLLA